MPPTRVIPLTVASALFMEFIDNAAIATALPVMARDFGVPAAELSLAITTYLVALAIFIPISGWLADRFGARRVFQLAIIGFLVGSMLAGLSRTVPELIAGRFVQGIGGALMIPVGRLVLLRSVPRKDLLDALAWLTIPALIGPAIGPPLGGFLATTVGWRAIFFINIPVGLLGMLAAWRFLPALPGGDAPRFDFKGFLLAAGGLAGIIIGFELFARLKGAGLIPLVLILASFGLIALYTRHQARVDRPLLDLSLMAIPSYRAGLIGGSLFRIGVGAVPFLLPLMLQLGYGLSALQSGLITFATALGAVSAKPVARRVIARLGYRNTLVLTGFLAAAMMAATGFVSPSWPVAAALGLLYLAGLFRSLQFTAINTLTVCDVPEARLSRATTLTSTAQQVVLSFGVAIGASLITVLPALRGAPTAEPFDFTLAFVIVGALAALNVVSFARLPADAGAAVLPGAGPKGDKSDGAEGTP
jgi:EmrB/QacA subfamily drug resistance transporter